MVDILVRALSLVAIVGLGLLAKRLRWASVTDFPLFSKLVLYVTLPAAIAGAFNALEVTASLLMLSVLALVVATLHQAAGWVALRRGGSQDQAFGILNTGGFNVGAFATPYISGMLGPGAVVYTSMYDVGNAVGLAGTGYSTAMALAEGRRPSIVQFVARMFRNPVFVTYTALLTMRLLDVSIPERLMVFVNTVGAANPFLAMFMVGIGLQLNLPRAKVSRAALILAVRYGLSVAFALLIWFLLPFDQTVRAILVVLMFAPIGAAAPILTAEARGDVQLSTFTVTVSILVGIVVMPLLLSALVA